MRISPDILPILSDLDVVGNKVRITGQLDRAMYTKVNKVLEAIGGKWNRSAKAHVFGSDAQPRLDLVITTGEVETGQDVGWFPTPAPLAKNLVKMAGVQRGDRVLEPSAGEGAIVLAIQDAGATVVAVERDPGRRLHLVQKVLKGRDRFADISDFMNYRLEQRDGQPFDRVVMNPPFCKVGDGDHLDHVEHAFSLLRPGGVLVSVLPSSVEFRRDRRYTAFRNKVLDCGTIEPLPEGSFKASKTGVNTCVVRMVKS